MNETFVQLGKLGIIPVVEIEEVVAARPLAQALLAGGLPCAEITFRTTAAAASLQAITSAFPAMWAGAGTILTVAQAETAVSAGAKFIVSPGFDTAVVEWSLAHAVPVIPGVMTPTEINMALNKGLTLLKFFPAEAAGGIKTLQAIGGPYRGVKFIPTGGITPENLADYLRLPMVHACGGSWLVSSLLVASGSFVTITKLTQEAVAIVKRVRGNQ